ncbi:DUF72 domain-containing protein [Thaumasiovibrio subtropicus]|uniref:DUF72 domain-containing protein n=1 Tax=Thaumasiovibrio subtropicus TaxID=1891207 RepID=UPI001FE4A7FA|nr:DUF72 domain-containing protein [Thaumasiovibrio subtropicus]
MLYLGLAQWSSSAWQQCLYGKGAPTSERLAHYARVFNTVEGSTTFYATPSRTVANQWASAVNDTFRFTFKLPQMITHQQQLRHSQQSVRDFFEAMSPTIEKTGIWKIQLPANFGPAQVQDLEKFLRQMPAGLPMGVEVRHPAFFQKGDDERRLNAMLIEHQANRIIMDSRPVFSHVRDDAALIDAQQKKPRVPVHAIATAETPMIRFIGIDRDNTIEDWRANLPFFESWTTKISQWLNEGKSPYLMIHTPDNHFGPELAQALYQRLQQQVSTLPDLPPLLENPKDQQLSLL